MPPPIEVFLTTIASQPALRQRQEYLLRTLQVRKIPFLSYDLASDETAKKRWKRKAPPGKFELPGILIGGVYVGPFADFEDATEHDELDIFLKRNEPWNPVLDEDAPSSSHDDPTTTTTTTASSGTTRTKKPIPAIGVPGASLPSVMNSSHKPSFSNKPPPSVQKDKEWEKEAFDISTELNGYGFQGVKMTNDELRALADELDGELGLGGAGARDLVEGMKGLDVSDNKGAVEERKEEEAKDLKKEESKQDGPGEKNSSV